MVNHIGVIERTLAWGPPRLSLFTYKCHFLETTLFYKKKKLAVIVVIFLIAMIKQLQKAVGGQEVSHWLRVHRAEGQSPSWCELWVQETTHSHLSSWNWTSEEELALSWLFRYLLCFLLSQWKTLIQGLAKEYFPLVKIL